jgi:hypothetical protein
MQFFCPQRVTPTAMEKWRRPCLLRIWRDGGPPPGCDGPTTCCVPTMTSHAEGSRGRGREKGWPHRREEAHWSRTGITGEVAGRRQWGPAAPSSRPRSPCSSGSWGTCQREGSRPSSSKKTTTCGEGVVLADLLLFSASRHPAA